MADHVDRLSNRLGYEFRNPALIEQALTHRSASVSHNERLEFLGDSVLNFVVAEALFHQFPKLREGELTRLRARMVRRETLAALARDVELGECLKLGAGELKSGGRDRDSILADALEAVIGAVYVDSSDLATASACWHRIAGARLEALESRAAEKDPKTRLQEWLQSRHLPLPEYSVREVGETGQDHTFMVECTLSVLNKAAVGRGLNRRGAEQEAAMRVLELVETGD